MAAVNESIVREFFELNGFLVRQFRKHVAPGGKEDDDLDFLVINPDPVKPAGKRPMLLETADLGQIERALVVVKPWHTCVFSPAQLANAPEIFRFLEQKAFLGAMKDFTATAPPTKILVVPELPADRTQREQSLEVMRDKGIEGVLTFSGMLVELIRQVHPSRNYQKSDLLQTLRILKHYDLFREGQMELFKARRGRK